MVEENGGSLSPGQRLTRIENRLDTIFERLDNRISEHKKSNDAQIAQLARDIMTKFDGRLTALETSDTSEHAVKEALEEYQRHQAEKQDKQAANIKWGISVLASLGIINIVIQAMSS